MTDAAAAAAPIPTSSRPKLGALDIDCHESTHMRRAMSTRKLISNPNRHDDLLRSGSTHQLLNRPHRAAPGSLLAPISQSPQTAGASSLATEQTAEESEDDSGSEFSGGSFCEAEDNAHADREYLRKDLGASLHDDELDFQSNDGDNDDEEADGLINDVKARMKIEEEAAAKKAES